MACPLCIHSAQRLVCYVAFLPVGLMPTSVLVLVLGARVRCGSNRPFGSVELGELEFVGTALAVWMSAGLGSAVGLCGPPSWGTCGI